MLATHVTYFLCVDLVSIDYTSILAPVKMIRLYPR